MISGSTLESGRVFPMNKLTIDLENCYGIKKLLASLDFSNEPVYAIYAPNGMMKSSLAKTFQDIADGADSTDRIFPARVTKRNILDETGKPIAKESALVVSPNVSPFGRTEKTSTLLVDPKLRQEWEQLHISIDQAQTALLKAVNQQAKSKRDFEKEITSAFARPDFITALGSIERELDDQKDSPFEDIEYDKIFDDRVLSFLQSGNVKDAISAYVNRYNELLKGSKYFKKGTFDYYNGAQIAKVLAKNGFFDAKHTVNLVNGGRREIKTEQELQKVIDDEKDALMKDRNLRKAFNDVENLITGHATLREFQSYLAEHEALLSQMANIEHFKQDVLRSYLKAQFDLYRDLMNKIDAAKARRRAIEERAAEQSTEWETVVQIFNERFDVPFKLTVNKIAVMLRQQPLQLGFTYYDGNDTAPIAEDSLLKWLSTGERKAYQILNVIFEVRAREKAKTETIIIVDDIADSFDYQNKYAIIQYLSEIGEEGLFKQVIMTHNFDFFRTLGSRCVTHTHCLMVSKDENGISLVPAEGIRNVFLWELQNQFFKSTAKKIACIPFLRNLIELREGVGDPDFKTLTSLLHWKTNSVAIKEADLDPIYNKILGKNGKSDNGDQLMVDVIHKEADSCTTAGSGMNFENKVVLSIAIRLAAEKYMVQKINNAVETNAITSNQTLKLSKMFRKKFPTDTIALKVIDRVTLMTPENIHLNSFMYEPIIDMADGHLRTLYKDVQALK